MKNLKWIAAAALVGALGGLYLIRSQKNIDTSMDEEHARTDPDSADRKALSPLPPPSARKPIIITQRQELLTTDPMSADYDPSMLVRVNRADASELFELEMQAEDWAPDFEGYLQQYIQTSLADILVDIPIEVECRTATCKVKVNTESFDESKTKLISDYLSQVAPIGPVTQIGTSGSTPGYLTIFSVLPPEVRSRDGFSSFAADFANGGGERLEAQKKHLVEKMQADKSP